MWLKRFNNNRFYIKIKVQTGTKIGIIASEPDVHLPQYQNLQFNAMDIQILENYILGEMGTCNCKFFHNS